ncbi:uncharacterized protein OCT59_003957 [Rhizophagus irregularis]|uniref:Uncharacterized protein n=2 Tax=Rhizophagus irregularis TaxID=588596 RepID=A0A015KRT5_RHIIW|nr:hypothetical protein RirG_088580 [Rhizophagus irregularis DAOM 197198w]UZO12420.1 hypothetical protein OCT59_003957 [Rhizophagus irregularis]
MSDFRSDLNPPPKFENELPVGYVGATIMPGPVIATDNELPKLERVKEKDPNKGNQTETGTCVETEKEIPDDQGKTREHEKPSLIRGTENTITGTLKEAIGIFSGKKETKDEGKEQKEHAKNEVNNSYQENKFDNKLE